MVLTNMKQKNNTISRLSFKQHMSMILRCMKNIRIIVSVFILTIVAIVYALWPSDPDTNAMRVTLSHVRVHTSPRPVIDVSFNATVEVENMRSTYTLYYSTIDVAIEYRGKELGHVVARGGEPVRKMGSSYVDATVEFEGAEVDTDWVNFLDDYGKGLIQLDTVAQVDGILSLLFQFPIKAKYSCKIDVDIDNQTIIHQICLPKAMELAFSFSFPIPFMPQGLVLVQIALRF